MSVEEARELALEMSEVGSNRRIKINKNNEEKISENKKII